MGTRVLAFMLAYFLLVLPQTLNSRSVILLLDDYGATSSPFAEEEEVKHSCTINWTSLLGDSNARARVAMMPPLDEPHHPVKHAEVAVPPPKDRV